MAVTLCQTRDIPEGGAKGFTLAGRGVLAVKHQGRIHLYLNRCPHLGLPLEWEPDQFLDADGTYIRCANHGALFTKATGECLQGPCRGDYLWEIEHRESDGRVVIADVDLPPPPR